RPGQLADVCWARFNCITAVYPQNISSIAEDHDDSCELLRIREAGRLISLPVTEVQDHDRWHRLSFSVVITRFAVLAFSTPVCQRRRSTRLLQRRPPRSAPPAEAAPSSLDRPSREWDRCPRGSRGSCT